jgi:hypothetical protein
MLEAEKTETSQLDQNEKPLLEVAREILEYRLQTCDNCPSSYARYQREQITSIDKEIEKGNPGYFRNGIHHEALFFTALEQRYAPNYPYQNPHVSCSTGDQDQRGIDFLIKTKNSAFKIDVTINPKSYPKKLKSNHALPLLLPMVDPDTEKNFLNYFKTHILERDLEDFLKETFWLNTYILNNKHKNYSVFVKEKGKKKSQPCSRRYSELPEIKIPHYTTNHQIYLSKKKRQLMLNLLSVIRNPTL